MNNWREYSIGELVELSQGQVINAQTNHLVVQEGIPLLRITDMLNHTQIVFIDKNKVPAKNIAMPEDIIYTRTGQVGLVFKNQFGVVHNNCFKVIPKNNKIDRNFLYWFLRTGFVYKFVNGIASGSAQPDLPHPSFKSIKIKLPDLPSQRKIASILSTYDELIKNNNQRIKLLEEMAEEIYKEWFVRLRFTGYETCAFFEGEGSESPNFVKCSLPMGWEKVTINDAFEILGGGTPSTVIPEFWQEGKINWFSPTDITGSKNIFLNKSGNQITALGLNNSSAKLFPAKSVMITSRATIGAIGINMTEATTNQGFITCIPNINFSYPYIYEWVKSNIKLLDSYSTGATFKEISKGVFKKLLILKPGVMIMKAFTEVVEPMFDEMNILGQKIELLQQTRDLLLPRLISGKLSVEHLVEQNAEGVSGLQHLK